VAIYEHKPLELLKSDTELSYVLVHPMSMAPTRAYSTSAGLDLYSCESFVLKPQTLGCISTGIRVCIPHGYFGKIESRSSNALQYHTVILGGIIDESYTGILQVLIYNLSKTRPFHIHVHSRIAQMIIAKCAYPDLHRVDSLTQTDRGVGGFGSSDNNNSNNN
jgi:dUTP pyrophosphatase